MHTQTHSHTHSHTHAHAYTHTHGSLIGREMEGKRFEGTRNREERERVVKKWRWREREW